VIPPSLYAIGALAIAAGGMFAWAKIEQGKARFAQAQVATLTDERNRAVAVANQNAAAIAELQAEVTRQQGIAAEARQLADRRAATNTALRRSIDRAPTSDDAAVAPVLRRTLDGLRDGPASGAH